MDWKQGLPKGSLAVKQNERNGRPGAEVECDGLGKVDLEAVRCSRSRMVFWALSEVGVCKY